MKTDILESGHSKTGERKTAKQLYAAIIVTIVILAFAFISLGKAFNNKALKDNAKDSQVTQPQGQPLQSK